MGADLYLLHRPSKSAIGGHKRRELAAAGWGPLTLEQVRGLPLGEAELELVTSWAEPLGGLFEVWTDDVGGTPWDGVSQPWGSSMRDTPPEPGWTVVDLDDAVQAWLDTHEATDA